jgi:hypothetical protein
MAAPSQSASSLIAIGIPFVDDSGTVNPKPHFVRVSFETDQAARRFLEEHSKKFANFYNVLRGTDDTCFHIQLDLVHGANKTVGDIVNILKNIFGETKVGTLLRKYTC